LPSHSVLGAHMTRARQETRLFQSSEALNDCDCLTAAEHSDCLTLLTVGYLLTETAAPSWLYILWEEQAVSWSTALLACTIFLFLGRQIIHLCEEICNVLTFSGPSSESERFDCLSVTDPAQREPPCTDCSSCLVTRATLPHP
jgi:hypothetical protein